MFLQADRGDVGLWILLITLLSIIISLYTCDAEIQRLLSARDNINEQIVMSLAGAAKRIDFYEASEGNIVIEGDFVDQVERYMKEALILDEMMYPINEQDFGLTGPVAINQLEVVTSGYDPITQKTYRDTGLVAVVNIPMTMRVLGLDIPLDIPLKTYAEIFD